MQNFTLTRTRSEDSSQLPLFTRVKSLNFNLGFSSSQNTFSYARNVLSVLHLIFLIAITIIFGIYLGFSLSFVANVETLNLVIHAPTFSSQKGPVTVTSVPITQYKLWIPVVVFLVAGIIIGKVWPG